MSDRDELKKLQDRIENAEGCLGRYEPIGLPQRGETPADPERPGEDTRIRSVTYSWGDHVVFEPVYWYNLTLTLYETGECRCQCSVKNVSTFSDWDCWLEFKAKARVTGAEVFIIGDEVVFQDLDHGEDFPKDQSWFSGEVRSYFDDFYKGNFGPTCTGWKRRDNKEG